MTEREIPLIDKNECFYCHLPLTFRHDSLNPWGRMDFAVWNAITREGDVEVRRPYHHECSKKEEQEILTTRDWERGERYSREGCITNPLARAQYVAPCGCGFDLLNNKLDGPYSFAGMNPYCWKHALTIKEPSLFFLHHGGRRASAWAMRRFYSFVQKNLRSQSQFQIDDPYTDQRAKEQPKP